MQTSYKVRALLVWCYRALLTAKLQVQRKPRGASQKGWLKSHKIGKVRKLTEPQSVSVYISSKNIKTKQSFQNIPVLNPCHKSLTETSPWGVLSWKQIYTHIRIYGCILLDMYTVTMYITLKVRIKVEKDTTKQKKIDSDSRTRIPHFYTI